MLQFNGCDSFQQEGGALMSNPLIALAVAIVAGVAVHYICKWLDS